MDTVDCIVIKKLYTRRENMSIIKGISRLVSAVFLMLLAITNNAIFAIGLLASSSFLLGIYVGEKFNRK